MDSIRVIGRDSAVPRCNGMKAKCWFLNWSSNSLAVNPNYQEINVQEALANPDSIFLTSKLVPNS